MSARAGVSDLRGFWLAGESRKERDSCRFRRFSSLFVAYSSCSCSNFSASNLVAE